MSNHHNVGVLLTREVIGKALYSHSAARAGRLLKLFITEVGYTHTSYRTEEGAAGSFATGNQGKGARNWEAISFFQAKNIILECLVERIETAKRILTNLEDEKLRIMATHPNIDDLRLQAEPDSTITVESTTKTKDGTFDELYAKRNPPEGFEYPTVGMKVTAMVNYLTPSSNDATIPAGAVGEVRGIRMPNDPNVSGYIGCVMFFEEVSSAYPTGLVVPWDMITYFKFD